MLIWGGESSAGTLTLVLRYYLILNVVLNCGGPTDTFYLQRVFIITKWRTPCVNDSRWCTELEEWDAEGCGEEVWLQGSAMPLTALCCEDGVRPEGKETPADHTGLPQCELHRRCPDCYPLEQKPGLTWFCTTLSSLWFKSGYEILHG